MIGVALAAIGTFFNEIACSIGKFKNGQNLESVYTMGFLGTFISTVILLIIGLFQGNFVFQAASFPTFALRAVLEVAQAHIAMVAISRSDRSSFGFIRTLTIPLLFIVDLILGYEINKIQIAGIGLILFTLFLIFMEKDIKKKGAGFVLFTAINAVATITLYKYNITHYNSVVAEASLINLILLVYFFTTALIFAKEDPVKFLKKPVYFLQSAADGIGSTLVSFAYSFAPASIVLTTVRSAAIFWNVLSGKLYFHEDHIFKKAFALVLLIIGIILLMI